MALDLQGNRLHPSPVPMEQREAEVSSDSSASYRSVLDGCPRLSASSSLQACYHLRSLITVVLKWNLKDERVFTTKIYAILLPFKASADIKTSAFQALIAGSDLMSVGETPGPACD